MTSYYPDYKEKAEAREALKASGYLPLDELPSLGTPLIQRDMGGSILAKAIQAGLIWDEEGLIVSTRDRGVTDAGARFLILTDEWGINPWQDFYVKPGMLEELVQFLDDASG